MYYSRVNNNQKEHLEDHLKQVSKLCGDFCSEFTNRKIGELIGWLHDAGKMTERFQNVLNKKEDHVNHAVIGGIIAKRDGFEGLVGCDKNTTRMISDIVAAHHSSIQSDDISLTARPSAWDNLLYGRKYAVSSNNEFNQICKWYCSQVQAGNISKLNYNLKDDFNNIVTTGEHEYNLHIGKMLFERMLFSCLVDADYSAAASFSNPNYLDETTNDLNTNNNLISMQYFLDHYYHMLTSMGNPNNPMNQLRRYVYDHCENAATQPSGLFTLTSPTGTGKTLALLNFALKHASTFKKKRIFVVLPYLSVTSQTVDLYKKIFAMNNIVLEDDSQVEHLTDNEKELTSRWTSPIIVPTSVKFFETLFDSHATSIRKLHNLCNSIIIIDEFQSIPQHVLNATLYSLRELSKRYGCTVVFSSATPPDFSLRAGLDWWGHEVREIIPDIHWLYNKYSQIKKINVDWNIDTKQTTDSLATKMTNANNACCIVNTKKIANDIYKKVVSQHPENTFLLTTNMCNAHRRDNILKIKEACLEHVPVRVVSTQCIEAGVDLSFQTMYREIAPVESIIQASGRCVRHTEGVGDMEIFALSEEKNPDVNYRNAKEKTKALYKRLQKSGIDFDINDIGMLENYYSILYKTSGFEHDNDKLSEAIYDENYDEVDEKYCIIEQREQMRIIVPYQNQIQIYNDFLDVFKYGHGMVSMRDLKKVQTIMVNTLEMDYKHYCKPIYIKTPHHPEGIQSDFYILLPDCIHVKYDNNTGLQLADNCSNTIF